MQYRRNPDRFADLSQAWARVLPRHSDIRNTTFVDLDSGRMEPFNYVGITAEDEQSVINCWFGPAKEKYARLPDVSGHTAAEYLVTGRVIRASDAATGGRAGAAILHVCGPDRAPVLTFGIARRPLDGAQLWRLLHETASAKPKPLEFPQVPWIALRPEPEAAAHGPMLPVLKEIGRVMAWTWLRLQTFNEQNGKEK